MAIEVRVSSNIPSRGYYGGKQEGVALWSIDQPSPNGCRVVCLREMDGCSYAVLGKAKYQMPGVVARAIMAGLPAPDRGRKNLRPARYHKGGAVDRTQTW